ncbi:hypothetical protein [Pyxidicoccus trucidator]|uniref:hypothetical protein n=1 Tax=Pyxidicoccus trucidator TaxID=2709662 RepID=UPI0013DC0242|nr:hypothetical protein [Pyxidicoccus trucidator]
MTRKIPSTWRAFALAAPSLTALLLPVAAPARDPEQPTEERKREGRDDLTVDGGRAGSSNPFVDTTTGSTGIGIQLNGAGMPVRRVTPDEGRMRELTGEVVKLNGQVLYVQTEPGAVVPLDLSALQLRKAPEKGQVVVAVYQVENKTENVALSLAGEVSEPG